MSNEPLTREALLKKADELELNLPKDISNADLKDKVERESSARLIRIEEEIRDELRTKARIKQQIAEIKDTAKRIGYELTIPENPTIEDVIRLQKDVGIKKKAPKPSPETIAIEKSKRVYAVFHNMEEDDVDVTCNVGGNYRFHFWPEKVHVIPQWLIGSQREHCVHPIYERIVDPLTKEEKCVRTGSKRRFMFEPIGDAPDDASFGVVLDDETLKKIQQPTA